MRLHERIALILGILALSGCVQQDRMTSPRNQYPPSSPIAALHAREAALFVSDLAPASGNVVVVAGVLTLADSLTLGSFVARLSYDATSLHYLGESDADEMMRVVNAEQGKLTIAAAVSGGAKTGRLFTFRFRVDDPKAIAALRLSITELNDAAYVSRLSAIQFAAAPRLDKSLAPKRANPE